MGYNISIIDYNKTLNVSLKDMSLIEYYNSIIYQIYSKMIYKFIDDKLIIAKATSIMGTYAIVKFFEVFILLSQYFQILRYDGARENTRTTKNKSSRRNLGLH